VNQCATRTRPRALEHHRAGERRRPHDIVQATPANQPAKGNIGGKPVLVFSDSTWLAAAAATVGNKLDFGVGDPFGDHEARHPPRGDASRWARRGRPGVAGLQLWLDPAEGVTDTGGKVSAWADKSPAGLTAFDGLQVFATLAGGGRPGAGLAGEGLMLTASAGSTVADGKLHLLALRRAGSALTLRLDGTQVATLTATPRSVDAVSPLQVGGRAALVHNAPNKVADVLIYRGAVSATDFASLESFVRTKNGI